MHLGAAGRFANNIKPYWLRQRVTSLGSEYWMTWLAETGSGTTGEKDRGRESGKRVPHVFSRARVDNARRQTGRLAERVGTHSGMMGNKGFVCHRQDRINQNKQPWTDCHWLGCLFHRLRHAWIERHGRRRAHFLYIKEHGARVMRKKYSVCYCWHWIDSVAELRKLKINTIFVANAFKTRWVSRYF